MSGINWQAPLVLEKLDKSGENEDLSSLLVSSEAWGARVAASEAAKQAEEQEDFWKKADEYWLWLVAKGYV